MNIRKKIDYSTMYRIIDEMMGRNPSQMELYCSIGQAVAARSEKGAAVMAAEYIASRYPDARGFSPRNLRRMRDYYRTYENHPTLLSLSMKLCWTQNVVIIEADLTMDLREWYIRAMAQLGWSKAELINRIAEQAHLEIVLDTEVKKCDDNGEKIVRVAMIIRVKPRISRINLRQDFMQHQCRGSPVQVKDALSRFP